MSDELPITAAGSGSLANETREELVARLNSYASALLAEAYRLEAAQHSSSGAPQVTSSHIADADLFLRRGFAKPKASKKAFWSSLTSYIAAFASGGFAAHLNKPIGAIGFASTFIGGVLAYFWGRD